MQQQVRRYHQQKVRLAYYLSRQYEETHYLRHRHNRHLRELLNNFQRERHQQKQCY
jgi:hypothetical protein